MNDHPSLFFRESALAHRYCRGTGLEIGGAAHNPFGLNTLNVDMPFLRWTAGNVINLTQRAYQ